MASSRGRLVEVDALRGMAAMAVVGFHFTTRFQDLYKPGSQLAWSVPWGHYGVNLFFMISGFVIFMTLQRTRTGMDFVVSRFSRLYPAYWAALALTWIITSTIGLPGRESGAGTVALNLLMFHGLFGVPHVDGAYWTLEVELIFYGWMLLLFKCRRLSQVHLAFMVLLALRWVYFIAERAWGVSLPWTVWRLLILQYLPWFALGVAVHAVAFGRRDGQPVGIQVWAGAAFALATLFITESAFIGGLAVAMALLLYGAATGRLRFLAWAPLAWLGAVSYPLYLLHEYIGWSLLLQALRAGLQLDLAVLLALGIVLLLAQTVSRTVEQPAMTWIRQWWRRRGAPPVQAQLE